MSWRLVVWTLTLLALAGCAKQENASGDGGSSREAGSRAPSEPPPGEAPSVTPGTPAPSGTEEAKARAASPGMIIENTAPPGPAVPPGIKLDPLVPWRQTGEPAATPGARTSPSGIDVTVLQVGAGTTPKTGARVKIHVTGWVVQGGRLGREFWNSRKTGAPQEVILRPGGLTEGVIPAFVEVLQFMRPGDRWWLKVPSSLAYGEIGYVGAVPPRADVVFDLELVEFENT